MDCPRCGQTLAKGEDICWMCGFKQGATVDGAGPATSKKVQAHADISLFSSIKWGNITYLLVFVLLAAGAVALLWDTVESYVSSIELPDRVGAVDGAIGSILRQTGSVSSPGTASGNGYHMILPAGYNATKSYPLVMCLSPGGDGRGYAEYLKPLSQDGRWIIAGSTDYANGIGSDVFFPKVDSAIMDIRSKYNVQSDRIYLCGMSGGGQATYVMSYMKPGYFAGIIVNDGSLHRTLLDPTALRNARIKKAALLSGNADTIVPPQYMDRDKGLVEASGGKTTLIRFSGGHDLAPIETYREALNWLDGF